MNRNGNTYTVIYASVMVVVVAALLSFAALSLKDKQDQNVNMEKMQDILRSIGQGGDADKVEDKFAYIEEQYKKYIVREYTVNNKGEESDGDAFKILVNLKAEYDKPAQERNLPIFESRDDAGVTRYIMPVWGSGLWGPIWGYVSLDGDWDTVYGTVLGHKGETPGLGAEIATPPFEDQFKGKKIFKNGQLVSVAVLKGSGSSIGNPNAVDAISGGTITSKAVEIMIKNNFTEYGEYFKKMRSGAATEPSSPVAASDSITLNTMGNEQ